MNKNLIKTALISGLFFMILCFVLFLTLGSDKHNFVLATNWTNGTNLTGKINVMSNPVYSDVYLDGFFQGKTNILINNVPVGVHQLVIKKLGYSNSYNNVIVYPNITTFVNVTLVVSCTDTDKSTYPTKNPNVAGIVYSGLNSEVDYCIDEDSLMEFYCQTNQSTMISSQQYVCVNGCVNNACV